MKTTAPKSLIVALALILGVTAQHPQAAGANYNVADHGASGDGKTAGTAAIQKLIDLAASQGGGEIDFPAGTYLTGSLDLKSNVILHLAQGAIIQGSSNVADYPIITARWEGIEKPCHRALISASGAENIAITGCGVIAGDAVLGHIRDPRAPTLVEPISCKKVRVEGVTLKNTGVWTLHPTYCEDVTIAQVTFATTGYNSDGIDPDSCQRVLIDHCTFSTDDDNIAIKSGKGLEGVKIGKPSEDITITHCTFIKGHSSIALGSELSGGIRRVKISHCIFKNGSAAIYMKSRKGRAGFVEDVVADHLIVGPEPLLVIETAYPFNPDPQSVPGEEGWTSFSHIVLANVAAHSTRLVKVEATPEKPVDGLTLSNINGTCAQGSILRSVKNVTVENVRIDGVTGPLFQVDNVQGTGFAGGGLVEQKAPPAR